MQTPLKSQCHHVLLLTFNKVKCSNRQTAKKLVISPKKVESSLFVEPIVVGFTFDFDSYDRRKIMSQRLYRIKGQYGAATNQ